MKKIYLINIIVLCVIGIGNAQFVNKISFNNDNPDEKTFIKISCNTLFNQPNGTVISDFMEIEGNRIKIHANYEVSEGTKPSLSIDTFSIGFLPSGSYRLIIAGSINEGESVSYDTSYFTVNECLTTENKEIRNPELNIYPNPVRNDLFIDYFLPEIKNLSLIRIFNIIGEEIDRLEITDNEGKQKINTSNYEPGLYILKMTENGNEVFTRKFKVI
ncbi:MAG: T9SS type A sorting domain-containing protein [Bacteroidales bacterium]|nr:T9SS type A sorting domain-containing protein [Bacteroidales bacterium]